jgi:hypothetical protein
MTLLGDFIDTLTLRCLANVDDRDAVGSTGKCIVVPSNKTMSSTKETGIPWPQLPPELHLWMMSRESYKNHILHFPVQRMSQSEFSPLMIYFKPEEWLHLGCYAVWFL